MFDYSNQMYDAVFPNIQPPPAIPPPGRWTDSTVLEQTSAVSLDAIHLTTWSDLLQIFERRGLGYEFLPGGQGLIQNLQIDKMLAVSEHCRRG